MPEPVTTAVIATTAAAKVFGDLSSKLATNVAAKSAGPLRKLYERITADYNPHLHSTFLRCTKIKTLLNQDEPIDLLSIYVGPRFQCGNKNFDDIEVIEQCRTKKRVVISGSGGSGKTIFLKYLWRALFENPEGRIPVFVELRKLNDVNTSNDVLTYIYHTIVDANSDVTQDALKSLLKAGGFSFIFDGFDELDDQKKSSIGAQIVDLANYNPDCIVIVSTRPDDSVACWQAFSTFKVCPLNKDQVVELIERAPYDKVVKGLFIQRIKKDLYERHQSFLSMPLLAIMMLISFRTYADIPQKMHLFYEQAFDALFHRHDAMKEQFQRKLKTGLTSDVFKRYFSLFCLVTYHERKLSFTEAELNTYLDQAFKIESIKLNKAHFISDLADSVCVMQKDGLQYVFSHRSFQEYFVAYCVDRVVQKHASKLLPKFAQQQTDNVISMLFDMNQDLVESDYIQPFLDDFSKVSASWPKENQAPYRMEWLGYTLMFHFLGDTCGIGIDLSSDAGHALTMASKLYPNIFPKKENFNPSWAEVSVLEALSKKFGKKRGSLTIGVVTKNGYAPHFSITAQNGNLETSGKLDWIDKASHVVWSADAVRLLPNLKKRVAARKRLKRTSLEELLS